MTARTSLLFVSAALWIAPLGCTGESVPEPVPPPVVEAPPVVEPPPSVEPPAADTASKLVPSPAQVQKALADAGLSPKVEALVADRDIRVAVENKDQVALRTGVVLAHLVLTAKQAPKDKTLARLAHVREGMVSLGAGPDIPATIDDLTTRLKNDAINSDDLVAEMDELSRVLVPEMKYEAGERIIPLIQAGGWLEGAHFVAGAMKAEGRYDAATKLLKQPDVIDYFQEYTKTEAPGRVPDLVTDKLDAAMTKLKEVSQKETLGPEDVDAVHAATGDVLALL